MNTAALEALAARWRADAERFRTLGQEAAARMSEAHAQELDVVLHVWLTEALTLEQAAEESGMSYSVLQHRLADGTLPNVGEKGAPRIRRVDLPSKGGRTAPAVQDGEPDLVAEVFGA